MPINKIVKGDKFICTHPRLGDALIGTVIALTKDETKMIGLQFDEPMNGHTCDGRGKDKHCLWVRPAHLMTVEDYEDQMKAKEAARELTKANDLEELTFE